MNICELNRTWAEGCVITTLTLNDLETQFLLFLHNVFIFSLGSWLMRIKLYRSNIIRLRKVIKKKKASISQHLSNTKTNPVTKTFSSHLRGSNCLNPLKTKQLIDEVAKYIFFLICEQVRVWGTEKKWQNISLSNFKRWMRNQ